MRPQDIVILLKIITKKDSSWMMKDLAYELQISASEVSESLARSAYCGLLGPDKRRIMKSNLLDFLRYGLKYVFPTQPGALTRGMPTAISAPPLNDLISSVEQFVWPYEKGNIRGSAILPLIPTLPHACSEDPELHELAALTDALRVGKARESTLAYAELEKRIK